MKTKQDNLVSVVIPCYNASSFIKDAISSVFNQTYPHIELIVVNDGSTDKTKEIVKEFKDRIIYVEQANAGVSAARNRGLELATGKYICFLDADDWCYKENFQEKVFVLDNFPNIALVHSWVQTTDENLNPSGPVLKGKEGNITRELLKFSPPAIPCPSNVLIRTAIVKAIGGFDPVLSTSADFDLWIRVAMEYPVAMINKILIKYRQHGNNMFSKLDLQLKDKNHIYSKYKNQEIGKLNWKEHKKNFYYSLAGEFFKRKQYISFSKYFFLFLINLLIFKAHKGDKINIPSGINKEII